MSLAVREEIVEVIQTSLVLVEVIQIALVERIRW